MNSSSGLIIDGVTYFSAVEVARSVGVSRQTLWRWRQEGKVPAGRKYRDKQVVFTRAESDLIHDYAQRLEPIATDAFDGSEQQRLFGREGGE